MDPTPAVVRSSPVRMLWGAGLGAVAWPVDVVLAVVGVVSLRRRVPLRAVSAVVGFHGRRTMRFLGWADDGAALTSSRAAGYLVMRVGVGLLGVLVLGLLVYGLFAVVAGLASWLFDVRFTVLDPDQSEGLTTGALLAMVPLGGVLLYLDLMGLFGVGRAGPGRCCAVAGAEPERAPGGAGRVADRQPGGAAGRAGCRARADRAGSARRGAAAGGGARVVGEPGAAGCWSGVCWGSVAGAGWSGG
ncbi:hypothetical protein ACFT2C_07595 [Promicromonospora sp. NPDC057138]|uniref:hypothetical protein n=1 Tax=Promicromonospora sp. NPDC057138 TaxID=3346031 RepID=UPI00363AE2FF